MRPLYFPDSLLNTTHSFLISDYYLCYLLFQNAIYLLPLSIRTNHAHPAQLSLIRHIFNWLSFINCIPLSLNFYVIIKYFYFELLKVCTYFHLSFEVIPALWNYITSNGSIFNKDTVHLIMLSECLLNEWIINNLLR